MKVRSRNIFLLVLTLMFCRNLSSQVIKNAYKETSIKYGKMYNDSIISVKSYSFSYLDYQQKVDTTKELVYFTIREQDGSGKFFKNN
ncbi:MAG: hypothetical protein AB7O73_04940, partial [Bacteroidia bacterium]